MAHVPVQPTGSVVDQELTEYTEIYACPIADTLEVADLITQTTGDVDAGPTRQITRTLLHNMTDIVAVGALQSQPFTFPAFLPKSDVKMAELWDSYENGSYMKFNVFHRDGSGFMGFWVVTKIKPTTDPTANSFSHEVTVEPFNVLPTPDVS